MHKYKLDIRKSTQTTICKQLLLLIIVIITGLSVTGQNLKSNSVSLKNPNLKNDPSQNKIYLPNGAHSNVSVVNIDYEMMPLEPGINWISIPRHTRDDDPMGNYTNISSVFDDDNFENGYNTFHLEYFKVNENSTTAEYFVDKANPYPWDYDPNENDNQIVLSTRGYKINLDESHYENSLILSGLLESSNTQLNLYPIEENWLGYFLYESQSPFDAIPENILEELTTIKGQGWCCVKEWQNIEGQPEYLWVCGVHKGDVELNYGDLVILESSSEEVISFQWQSTGIIPSILDKPETEYYQFNEQMDYTSFMIELDSTENPQEIGAFVGDSCVGASTVFVDDTIVLVPGYTDGLSGDVVFEEYYGSQKSSKQLIKKYFVSNNNSGLWEKRMINTSEGKEYYIISFNQTDDQKQTETKQCFNIFPNPVGNTLNINYDVEGAANVSLSVYDSFGRQITSLFNSIQSEGKHKIRWDLAGSNGKKISKGLYIIKLKINDKVMSKKIAVF